MAEMHRRGGAEPCRAGRSLDSNPFTNWHEDCTARISGRAPTAMRDNWNTSPALREDVSTTGSAPRLSLLLEESINTTAGQAHLLPAEIHRDLAEKSLVGTLRGFASSAMESERDRRNEEMAGSLPGCTLRRMRRVSVSSVCSLSGRGARLEKSPDLSEDC